MQDGTGDTAAHPPLDLRGLKCPLVVLRIRRAMAAIAPGETLQVLADDPMALVDVPVMCHHMRFGVVDRRDGEGQIRFAIAKPRGWTPPEKPGPIK